MLGPVETVVRDLRLILGVQALRAFVYGLGSVLIGSSLAAAGVSAVEAGLVFSAMLVGLAVSSVAVGLAGDRIGRRRAYAGLLAVMGAAGTVYALTDHPALLVAAALTGTLSTDPNESGPITSLEQAMIGEVPHRARARVFGRYNAVAYVAGAVGALAAGGPAALRDVLPSLPPAQRWLLAFPPVAAACVGLASRLSGAVEGRGASPAGPGGRTTPLGASRPMVLRLAGLFGLDAFAGGFVVQTFLVFWFRRRFGATPELMGAVFFGAGLLQAASSVAAGRLGGRIGLLETMVFTHLPSNVLLALVPLAPSLGAALAILLARFALSQMDVPARQAYVVALVEPPERTAAAAFTNTARSVARPVGPAAAGLLMQHLAVGAPFAVAGALKVVYDLVLYATFRRIPIEAARAEGGPGGRPGPSPT